MKKEWVAIFNLFSLTLSGFLIQAAVPVALGFLLIIFFGILVSVLPQSPVSLLTNLFIAVLALSLVHLLLKWIQRRFLFYIHVAYQSVIADLLYHGTRISPEISLIGQGRLIISGKCRDKKELWKQRLSIRPRLQNEDNSAISRAVFSIILPGLENILLSVALISNKKSLEESLQIQVQKYKQVEQEIIPYFRILFLLNLGISAAFFAIVFVPVLFLFHSFGVPFFFGLVLSLALMLIFRQAFYFPLMQMALLHRFHTLTTAAEPGSAPVSKAVTPQV